MAAEADSGGRARGGWPGRVGRRILELTHPGDQGGVGKRDRDERGERTPPRARLTVSPSAVSFIKSPGKGKGWRVSGGGCAFCRWWVATAMSYRGAPARLPVRRLHAGTAPARERHIGTPATTLRYVGRLGIVVGSLLAAQYSKNTRSTSLPPPRERVRGVRLAAAAPLRRAAAQTSVYEGVRGGGCAAFFNPWEQSIATACCLSATRVHRTAALSN